MKVYGFVGQPRGNKGPDALLLRALNGALTKKDLRLFFREESEGLLAASMLTSLLRYLVDAWIESGRGEQESPWERQPWREYLEDFISRNPPMLMSANGSLGLFLLPRIALGENIGLSKFAKDLEGRWLSELPDIDSFDGEVTINMLHSAADPATALYLQLLDSPIHARLFRCDWCRAYFVRERAPKRDMPIKRGAWCVDCKGRGSAKRTVDSRWNRTTQMIGWAVDVWEQWKQDRRHGERSEWVAQQVNNRHKSSRGRIARNWVTRHQAEIEVEVERRKHAKG